jgi:uncharacterized repeat protein (TIGR03803 family)
MSEKVQRVTVSVLTLALFSTLLLLSAHAAQAQTETVLYNFCSQAGCADGSNSSASLTPDGAGNFYGTTTYGGLGYGTVFELSPSEGGGWTETVLYAFTGGSDGALPYTSGVISDSVGNLYGTTFHGGANGIGVVYELSPVGGNWQETVIWSFEGAALPIGNLIMDASGNLYGLSENYGVFELSPNGSGGWNEQIICNITSVTSALTMDSAGNIYYTGSSGSSMYKLSPSGGTWTVTAIHNFAGGTKDGSDPQGAPSVDSAGNVYGVAASGGAKNAGVVFKLSPIVTGKKKGTYTEKLLYSFKSGKDGSFPLAGIVFDSVGNIYGTTSLDGKSGAGTVFELVAPAGKAAYKEKVLWSFNVTDGTYPYASLTLDGAGNIYGTTWEGGSNEDGVVFEVTP